MLLMLLYADGEINKISIWNVYVELQSATTRTLVHI